MTVRTESAAFSAAKRDGEGTVERTRWLYWGVCAAALLVLLLVTTELLSMAALVLTASGPRRGNTQHSYYADKPWKDAYWDEVSRASPTFYSPYVTWKRGGFHGRHVNIEPTGLRRTVNPQCTPDAAEVWFMGSSTLWGTGARDDQTIPSIFSAEYARSIGPVCVSNWAEAGWVSTQNVIQLTLALKNAPRKPDLVIFDDGFADVFTVWESGQADKHMDYERIRNLFDSNIRKRAGFGYLRDTATYRVATQFMTRVDRLRASSKPAAAAPGRTAPDRDSDALAQLAVDNYSKNLQLIRALSKGFGFRYLAFWGPALYVGRKPLAPAEQQILERESAAARGLPELARKTYALMFARKHDDLFDLSGIFDTVPADVYLDPSHVTPDGNRLLALRILEQVQRQQAAGR